MIGAVACAALFACDEETATDGEALRGDVSGDFGSQRFDPTFGVAVAVADDPVGNALAIQLGEHPLSCEAPLVDGPGNPVGLFTILRLPKAEVGVYGEAYVEYLELGQSSSVQRAGNGKVELTSVTDARIVGTVAYEAEAEGVGRVSLRGEFDVRRCP